MTTHAQEILLRLHQPLELEGRVQEIIDNVRREVLGEAAQVARTFKPCSTCEGELSEPGWCVNGEIADAILAKAKEPQGDRRGIR
jgi:hypothetical protein